VLGRAPSGLAGGEEGIGDDPAHLAAREDVPSQDQGPLVGMGRAALAADHRVG
jgi:hypothetical protein